MKKVIFNYNNYKSENETYKDFYRDIVKQLNNFIDFEGDENLGFNADVLNEFMWYNSRKNLKIVIKNIDIKKVKEQKTHDAYKWKLILEVLHDFVTKYPNNTLEFRNE